MTSLYLEITKRLQEAEARNTGGGACCGDAECLKSHPFAEYIGGQRTDLPYYRDYRLNELCKVIEALRARVEELEQARVEVLRPETRYRDCGDSECPGCLWPYDKEPCHAPEVKS